MNDWLNTDDSLTKYYSANMTANFVHHILLALILLAQLV